MANEPDGKRPRKGREEPEVVRVYKPEPGALENALRAILERRHKSPSEGGEGAPAYPRRPRAG